MPGKRGSKVAAAQARAKAAAKKKARQGGPVLPAAAYVPPPTEAEEEEVEAEELAAQPAATPAPVRRPVATATRPQAIRSISMRRERHAAPALSGAGLKRELGMIAGLTGIVGVVLAVLKLATDIGA